MAITMANLRKDPRIQANRRNANLASNALTRSSGDGALASRVGNRTLATSLRDRLSSRKADSSRGGSLAGGLGTGGGSSGTNNGSSSGGGSSVGDGGTDPMAQITIPGDVVTPAYQQIAGLSTDLDVSAIESQLDLTATSLDDAITKLEQANAPLLEGKIPQDVQDQLRMLSSERAQTTGAFGQGSQARTARDFGLTSLQLKESAMATQGNLAELRRAQYGMLETRREFDKTFRLQTQEMLENMRRTDLDATQLDLQRRQFNAEQNLSVIQMVADLATQRADIQYRYAYSDVSGGNAAGADLNQIISQLDSLLARPAVVT